MKKIERGTLYLGGLYGQKIEVKPIDGKKFTLKELQHAVGGYIEQLVSATRGVTVYVNEEGTLKGLPANSYTWEFAKMDVYRRNGYGPAWMVAGNAIAVRRVEPDEGTYQTVVQALIPAGRTEIFTLREGEWQVAVDGVLVAATFNSKRAARAAVAIERQLRAEKLVGE